MWFISFCKRNFPISLKDALKTMLILLVAAVLCLAPWGNDGGSDVYAALIFVLAVVMISRTTNGYFFGIFASFVAVIGVNYAFTYPYFEFNFSIQGYPLTFITMLAVSVVISTMTTQIKHQEKLKAQTEQEMMRANLLRAISHDLRTPLTSIIGSASAVIDNDSTLTSEQRIGLVSAIRDEAQWLIRMVENLLSITMIKDGETSQINKTPEAIEEIVGETVQKFKKQFQGIELIISIPDEVLFVPMDPMLIEQVLINLMCNAAEHGKTTTKIDFSVYTEDDKAVFSISDNGQGIDKEKLPTLFNGYMQGKDTRNNSDHNRNMGIGLSVCKTIVEAHGGKMYAENLPFGGARVYFKLPLS